MNPEEILSTIQDNQSELTRRLLIEYLSLLVEKSIFRYKHIPC